MNKIIILAAGKGRRMNSDLPKVLMPINGRPMISYLIESIMKSEIDEKPVVVVAPDNHDIIKKSLSDYSLDFVVQEKALGTGHAALSAKSFFGDKIKNILILYGDHPFIRPESIKKILDIHKSELSMMTVKLDDFNDWKKNFYHWGRIVRSSASRIKGIIEFKDADDVTKEIKELNPAIFCFNKNWFLKNIDKLKNDNNQGEYYLTDLIKIAFEQNIVINSSLIEAKEAIGVNGPEELEVARNLS